MGQDARAQSVSEVSLNLTKEEMQAAKERFNQLDRDRKGHITVNDIRRHFRVKFLMMQDAPIFLHYNFLKHKNKFFLDSLN